jgi:hypothetical protein
MRVEAAMVNLHIHLGIDAYAKLHSLQTVSHR